MPALSWSRTAMMNGKSVLLRVGPVQFGEAGPLGVGQRIEPGGGLFRRRCFGQPAGRRQPPRQVRMGFQHAEPLVLAGGPELPRERTVHADSGVMRRPQLVLPGALRDPRRMLENAAEAGNEALTVHRRRPFPHGRRRMHGLPVAGDVDAPREPDGLTPRRMFDEPPERHDAPRPPDEAAMQADRHHLRAAGLALGIEGVEAVPQIGEELVPGIETLRHGETHVVRVERVGDDQLVARADANPVGQVVGVGVRHIVEPAFLGGQRNGVVRAAARVPAARPLARDFRVQLHGLLQMFALLFERHVPVFDPFEAVACDLPAGGLHRRNLGGRARQGRRHAIDRDRDVEAGEQPVKAPETGPCAVFVERLHVPVPPARPGRGAHDLGKEGFRGRVAVKDAVLSAFLVIDDELNRDPGAAGPFRIGRLGSVTVQVSWISHHCLLRPANQFQRSPAVLIVKMGIASVQQYRLQVARRRTSPRGRRCLTAG